MTRRSWINLMIVVILLIAASVPYSTEAYPAVEVNVVDSRGRALSDVSVGRAWKSFGKLEIDQQSTDVSGTIRFSRQTISTSAAARLTALVLEWLRLNGPARTQVVHTIYFDGRLFDLDGVEDGSGERLTTLTCGVGQVVIPLDLASGSKSYRVMLRRPYDRLPRHLR